MANLKDLSFVDTRLEALRTVPRSSLQVFRKSVLKVSKLWSNARGPGGEHLVPEAVSIK